MNANTNQGDEIMAYAASSIPITCPTCNAPNRHGFKLDQMLSTKTEQKLSAYDELLKALKEVVDVTTVYHRNDPVGRPWLANALAAIAKAEGV